MRALALLCLISAACEQGTPVVEIDVVANPPGPSLTVAPCHPDKTAEECARNGSTILQSGESTAHAGIFDVPGDITQFKVQLTTGNVYPCTELDLFRKRPGQKMSVTLGATLVIVCEQSGDCGAPGVCQ